MDCFPLEYPTQGLGDFRESCLAVRRSNGQEQAELIYKGYKIYKGKPTLAGLPATWGEDSETLEIILTDAVAGLKVTLFYSVFEGMDALAKSVTIENIGEETVYLTKVLSSSLDIVITSYSIHYTKLYELSLTLKTR